jgi:hypothetical protein
MKRPLHIASVLLFIALVVTIALMVRQCHASKPEGRKHANPALRQIASFDLPGPAGKRYLSHN